MNMGTLRQRYGGRNTLRYDPDVIAVIDRLEALVEIERYGLVLGPEYKPGRGDGPKVGWVVYRDWQTAAADVYSLDGSARALAVAATLDGAIRRAVVEIERLRFDAVDLG